MTIRLKNIHAAVEAGRIKWLYHALLRFRERGITRGQAKHVMKEGQILEEHNKPSTSQNA